MRTVTIEVFELHEMTEEAQQNAYEEWRELRTPDAWDHEYRKVLESLERELQVSVTGWNVGEDCSHFRFDCDHRDGVESLQGLRAFKWLTNNLSLTTSKKRYRDSKTYASKVFLEDYILEDFNAGYVMVNVYKDLLEDRAYLLHELTVETFCEWVLEKFFDEWRTDKEDQMSFSYFCGEADTAGLEFYADGRTYND